jgi:hypothetical protein
MEFSEAVTCLCGEEWEAVRAGHATRRHEEILSALLPASRTAAGRMALGAAPGAIDALAAALADPLAYLQPIAALAVRLLRNLCARSTQNQQRAARAGVHDKVLDCIAARVADGRNRGGAESASLRRIQSKSHAADDPLDMLFFGFAVEFLCNFVTSNEANADLVWARAFPDLFFEILESGNKTLASAGAALLHNCIAITPERASDLVRIWSEPIGDRRSIAQYLVRKIHAAEGDGLDDDEEGDENAFDWAFMVIRRLVAGGLVEEVFDAVGPSLRSIVNHEQVSLSPYQMTLIGVLEAATSKAAESKESIHEFIIPEDSLLFFAKLQSVAWLQRDGSAFRLACNIVGSIILLNPVSMTPSPRMIEFKSQTTTSAVGALSNIFRKQNDPQTSSFTEDYSPAQVIGLRGAAVRLVGFAAEGDKDIQNLVRELGGLMPIISALSYEKDVTVNPYLREWAVIAVRSLCCGNQANADEIAKLELVDVQSNTAALKEAGLEAFIDPETGRPRVRVKSQTTDDE